MEKVTRVGIDLAKKVFHVTAVDAEGTVVERKRLRRAGLQSYLACLPRGCIVAMEACGGAHHWGRLAVRYGHRVSMMCPQFVVPYVKSNKNDVNDADAIAEASARPSMRFVGVKSVEQEHIQQLHRARQMAVRNRTAQINQLHGFLLEYGIAAPKGAAALLRRLAEVLEDAENELPMDDRPRRGRGVHTLVPTRVSSIPSRTALHCPHDNIVAARVSGRAARFLSSIPFTVPGRSGDERNTPP